MIQDSDQHVRLLKRLFDRLIREAERLLDRNETETSNTLAGIDVQATASAMAQLTESVLHSVESRVELFGRLSEMYAQRAFDSESIRKTLLERRETARADYERLPRGSLFRIGGLMGFSYLGTLGLGAVLGGLMDETLIAWVRLPIAMNIARSVAQTARLMAGKMGLSGPDATAFVAKIVSEATEWHPQPLYTSTTLLSLGLTCGLMLLQTHAQLSAGQPASKASKIPFVIADIAVGAGLYFMRSPNLSAINMTALAIAMFDASVLLTSLFASAKVGAAVYKERERRRAHADALNSRQKVEQHLASTEAEIIVASQKAYEFAAARDHLCADKAMQSAAIASVEKAAMRYATNTAKVEDEVKRDAQILHLFKREVPGRVST